MSARHDPAPVARVTVTAPGGAHVVIEACEPLGIVVAHADALLARAAELVGRRPPGAAVGFAVDRRASRPVQPSGMWRAPGPYPVQADAGDVAGPGAP